jgi:hypothetical protein
VRLRVYSLVPRLAGPCRSTPSVEMTSQATELTSGKFEQLEVGVHLGNHAITDSEIT